MLKPISKIAQGVTASTTLEIDAMFKQMLADGIDVVGFGAGEPDFGTPDNIKAAGISAIQNNLTKYTPAAGIIPLKKAICERIYADMGIKYEPSQVVVASGAKHNVFIAIMTLVDPGDEVIVPAPFWVSYYEMVKQAGGVPVIVQALESADFKITAEQLEASITDKTKALFLNSPSNPTGMIYTKEELEAIAAVCNKHNIYVIADEIYYKLVYGDSKFTSIASLGDEIKDRTIMINGVSKSYAMTGWRIGYAIANPTIAKAMTNYLSHSTSAPCTISQHAAIEALSASQDGIEEMRKEFEKRRNHLCERMNKVDGVSCLVPDGAFYVMMNMESFIGKTMYGTVIKDGDDFAKLFLQEGLVATVPGAGFGAPNYLRWSYATSIANIDKGIDRLEAFIKNA